MYNIKKYNDYIRFLANNIDHAYEVVSYIYDKEAEESTPCYRIYDKVQALDRLKELGNKDFIKENKIYSFNIFNFETNSKQKIRYYTNNNILEDVQVYLSNDDIDVIMNRLIDLYSLYFINIEFSNTINSFRATDINLQDKDLLIILPDSTKEEKVFNLIYLYIRLTLNINDEFNLKILSELVIYALGINFSSDGKYKTLTQYEWYNLFELGKLIYNHLQELLIKKIKCKLGSFNEINNIDVGENDIINFNTDDFKIDTSDYYLLLNKLGIDPLINNLDDFNILQSYRLWSLGNKEEYLSKMGILVKDNDKLIHGLIDKIKYYDKEKVYAELLRQQELLKGVYNGE